MRDVNHAAADPKAAKMSVVEACALRVVSGERCAEALATRKRGKKPLSVCAPIDMAVERLAGWWRLDSVDERP